MPTLLEKNNATKDARIKTAEHNRLWSSRNSWAKGHIFPGIEAALNDELLMDRFGELAQLGVRNFGVADGVKLEYALKGSLPHHGIAIGLKQMTGKTVFINPGAMSNYQFFAFVTGDTKGDRWASQYMSHVPSFSLSFSGTYYYMPNGHDGFTPRQIKSVGLPGPDDDPAEWVKDQVTRHFDYWVEHNTKHPNNGSEMNEHYATGYHFLFPKEL